MPLDENLIATLETSLRQTRNAQNRLMGRLREAENEVQNLRQEIEALENHAAQTESAIDSILVTLRSGRSRLWNNPDPGPGTKPPASRDDDYDDEFETRLHDARRAARPPANRSNNGAKNEKHSGSSVSYLNQNRGVPSIGSNIEAVSHRFSDLTITQACRLLLREYGKPLHVNEFYNLLVSGGMEFNGNNPTISIAVSLNRNRKFRKVAPGTFDLVIREAKQVAS